MEERATIFAPATAPGRAGVAVLRLSGPQAFAALAALCGRAAFPPRAMVSVRFSDPETGEAIDRGLAVCFPGPASFTGEDVAELHVHGSAAVLERLAGVLAGRPGVRWAEPGEFTRRAFEAGKMDLTETEALADLLAAETEAQRRQAVRQMDGALSRRFEDLRNRAVEVRAFIEAVIDFPEDELPAGTRDRGLTMIAGLKADLAELVDSARIGCRVRQGVTVAVLGAPNVGKSSLVNRLAGWDVAIVSATAGTTRDRVSVDLALEGLPVTVTDTAGLRAAAEEIEAEGIRRAERAVADADLRLAVFSAETWPAPEDPTWRWVDSGALVVVNKADLGGVAGGPPMKPPPIAVSALTGAGFDALADALRARVRALAGRQAGEAPPITRERHRALAAAALVALERAQAQTQQELQAEDVRLAIRELGRITGRIDVEDVLDRIFGEFCIGK
ncbi:tRNA uridine-5-carboxymethylaminomethyl(34) synthesis GTPase MnmE [Oleispirillum naphthae]|uniref:tRNA uridine-5-carboxymethylaminomethyl(34) synthesis GTPase MnmE n=1 Tax=Oleispirillum naphthae TaxID=2838853 RepID=UPI0030825DCD